MSAGALPGTRRSAARLTLQHFDTIARPRVPAGGAAAPAPSRRRRVALSFAHCPTWDCPGGNVMPLHRLVADRCSVCCPRSPLAAVMAFGAAPAAAADLTIGLGTDVTALDPHYHNLTPNNNVAAHIFGYLVAAQREVAARARPRHRMEGDRSADLGVQAAQGRQVPRRQRLHRRRRRRVDRARADGAEQPVAVHRLHQADQGDDRRRPATRSASRPRTPYPLMPSDMTQVAIISKAAGEGDHRRLQQRQGGDRHRPLQARALREGRPHRARAQRRVLGRQDAVGRR